MSTFIQFLKEKRIKNGLLSGNPNAMELLFETYAEKLFLYSLSILKKMEDAEEVIQNLFLKIIRNPKVLLKVKNLNAYLYTSIRNECIDFRKYQREEISTDQTCDIFSITANTEEELCFKKLIEELPKEQKEVLLFKIYYQISFKDIAEILKIPPNTAASRYRYALQSLKIKLGEQK